MCGRFTLTQPQDKIVEKFHVDHILSNFTPSYNIAPSHLCPIVYLDSESHKCTLEEFKWGLVPSWSKTSTSTYSTINARAETLTTKPAFKSCLSERRCLIPTDGFYEWHQENNTKLPYRIAHKDNGLFALAGLWSEWVSPDKSERIKTFTIITTEANERIARLHNRMPAILNESDWELWLKAGHQQQALALLHPYAKDDLVFYPVTSKVNNPRNNFPELILPLDTSA